MVLNTLMSLLPGAFIKKAVLAILAALVALWRARASGRRSERISARAKEADAYERSLEDIGRAHAARNRVGVDGLRHDKYRRD